MQKKIANIKDIYLHFLSPKEILLTIFLILISLISLIAFLYYSSNLLKVDRIIYKGEMKEGVVGVPKITNPYLSLNQAEKDLSTLLYSSLIKNVNTSSDSEKKFDLALASKVEISSDNLTMQVSLRPNAKFSNGDKIKNEDLIYSLQNIPLEKNFTTEISNEGSLIIKFKKDADREKNSLENNLQKLVFPIISKKEKFEENYSTNLITSSNFIIDKISKDADGNVSNITLKRFDNGEEKIPYLKILELVFYKDVGNALEAFQKKEIQMISGVDGTVISKIKEDSSFEIKTAKLPNNFSLFINQNKQEILRDTQFRQMLSKSIDRQNLVNQVLGGFGVPEKNILGENDKNIVINDLLKDLPSGLIFENGVLYVGNKAASSSREAVKISITTINNKELVETANFVAKTFQKLGIETKIITIDRSQLQAVVKDRDFDILLFGFSIKNNNDYYSFFSSKERVYPKLNIGNYTSKKVDALVESLQTETDKQQINNLLSSLSKEIESDMPIIMLYKPLFILAHGASYKLTLSDALQSEEDRYRHISTWYLYTEKVLRPFVKWNLINTLDIILN